MVNAECGFSTLLIFVDSASKGPDTWKVRGLAARLSFSTLELAAEGYLSTTPTDFKCFQQCLTWLS